jgi:DNA-binding NtrC family response regulator
MQRLLAYDFPGNIRELENLVRRLIVLRDPRYILGELQRTDSASQPIALTAMAPQPSGAPSPAAQVVHFPSDAAGYVNPSFAAGGLQRPPQPAMPMTYGYPPGPALSNPATAQPGLMTVTVSYETSNAPPGQIDDAYTIDLKELGRKAANAAEREAIVIMLRHTGGNKREAAERLGISYKAILYKIREFGIGRPRNRRPSPVAASAAAPAPSPALADEEDLEEDVEIVVAGTGDAPLSVVG